MKKLVLSLVLSICMVGIAQGSATFDFDALDTDNSTTISNYMTGIYGSSIAVTDAKATNNNNTSYDWSGHSGNDSFLRTNDGADMEILFSSPISSASGLGYVWDSTSGDNFIVKGYGSGYGSVENPSASAFVGSYGSNSTGQLTWSLDFGSPVSLLVISDDSSRDVGIDNLCVESCQTVPVPGAILLGSIGVSFVGWLRRRRTL